jgi:hypothetical protein
MSPCADVVKRQHDESLSIIPYCSTLTLVAVDAVEVESGVGGGGTRAKRESGVKL